MTRSIIILTLTLFLSSSIAKGQSEQDTIIVLNVDEVGTNKKTITTYINGSKIDSVYTNYRYSKWNRTIHVYRDSQLIEKTSFLRGKIESSVFYNGESFSKKIFYSKRKNGRINIIYYYTTNGDFRKAEFFDRNGALIKNEKKLSRKERKMNRKIRRTRKLYS